MITNSFNLTLSTHSQQDTPICRCTPCDSLIQAVGQQPRLVGASQFRLCALARNGDYFVTSFVMFWADETSGTRSKRFNYFETAWYTLLNIPHKLERQIYALRFIASVPEATCHDVMAAIVADLYKEVQPGVLAAAPGGDHVLVGGDITALLGDGPKLSGLSSHLGSRSRFMCRVAM
jgi:hypothetical protein